MTEMKQYWHDALTIGLLILAVQFYTLTKITGNLTHSYIALLALGGAWVSHGFAIGLSLGYDEQDMCPNWLQAVIRR